MHLVALAALALALGAAAAFAWHLAPDEPLPARFGAADCGRVELVDARTGGRVTGAEDLALAPDGVTLIVSAHDRADPALPDGGLYVLDVAALGPGAAVTARRLDARRSDGGRIRPHGIALSRDGARLAVINRVARDEAVIEIGALGPDGWTPDRRIADPRLCRANDLSFTGAADALEITRDRAGCGISLRDLLGGTGSVLRLDGDNLSATLTGLAFPNGIADGHIAETRASRLLRPDGGHIELPGGPDNLTEAPGGLVAAVHPSLLAIWLHLLGVLKAAPSRIVQVDAATGPSTGPSTGAVETLYDDPDGAFSAATAAVVVGDRLIAGSVSDAGLLVCGRRP